MADLKEVDPNQTPTEPTPQSEVAAPKKRAVKSKKTADRPLRTKRTRAATATGETLPSEPTPAPRRGRKTYTEKERAAKLAEIERQISSGTGVRAAVQAAGISEQTYYQWKKAETEAPQRSELEDLVKLEQENARLKALLADRLRKENAELKKKLGLS